MDLRLMCSLKNHMFPLLTQNSSIKSKPKLIYRTVVPWVLISEVLPSCSVSVGPESDPGLNLI